MLAVIGDVDVNVRTAPTAQEPVLSSHWLDGTPTLLHRPSMTVSKAGALRPLLHARKRQSGSGLPPSSRERRPPWTRRTGRGGGGAPRQRIWRGAERATTDGDEDQGWPTERNAKRREEEEEERTEMDMDFGVLADTSMYSSDKEERKVSDKDVERFMQQRRASMGNAVQ